jgi:hypothetical protein
MLHDNARIDFPYEIGYRESRDRRKQSGGWQKAL